MLILPADADESTVGGAVERITRILSERGGEVKDIDRWGRRRFAFPIARQTEGYYAVVRFTSDPAAITEIDRSLTLADEVLRFKVVVRDQARDEVSAEAPATAAEA
jgi:small subunit ribosomal protein S6